MRFMLCCWRPRTNWKVCNATKIKSPYCRQLMWLIRRQRHWMKSATTGFGEIIQAQWKWHGMVCACRMKPLFMHSNYDEIERWKKKVCAKETPTQKAKEKDYCYTYWQRHVKIIFEFITLGHLSLSPLMQTAIIQLQTNQCVWAFNLKTPTIFMQVSGQTTGRTFNAATVTVAVATVAAVDVAMFWEVINPAIGSIF